jgi:hypothetical protein
MNDHNLLSNPMTNFDNMSRLYNGNLYKFTLDYEQINIYELSELYIVKLGTHNI